MCGYSECRLSRRRHISVFGSKWLVVCCVVCVFAACCACWHLTAKMDNKLYAVAHRFFFSSSRCLSTTENSHFYCVYIFDSYRESGTTRRRKKTVSSTFLMITLNSMSSVVGRVIRNVLKTDISVVAHCVCLENVDADDNFSIYFHAINNKEIEHNNNNKLVCVCAVLCWDECVVDRY